MIENENRQIICWNKKLTPHITNKKLVSGVFFKTI